MRSTCTALLLVVLAVPAAEAIVIRHDRADALYRARPSGYPMVCRVGAGMGTLVDPRWVLTAAHVAESMLGGGEIRCGDETVTVEEAFLHPDYAVEGEHRDLGLLRLAEPLPGILPARLYDEDDELGRSVLFVGDGKTGTGRTGPVEGERVLRAARNAVSAVRPGWLEFVFDAPPAGDDLEGISGPGDSGGPALLERDGTLYVLGVSAYNDGGELCTYGTTEHYARVSDEREWIDGVMRGEIANDQRRILRHETGPDGRETVRSEEVREADASDALVRATDRVARRLFEAINANDRDAFRALFSETYLRREGRESVESMLDFMAGARAKRGDIVSMHPVTGHALRIEDTDRPMVPVIWHMADGTPGYFGLALDEEGRIVHFSLFVREDICSEGPHCTIAVPLRESS